MARLGFSDKDVFNGFGMGALLCSDGAFALGEMGEHTANAGRIYFPSGTPDLDDISGNAVDIAGSVTRELEEETGLTAAEYRGEADWHCVFTGPAVAMIRILRVDLPGEALRARIEANLAAATTPPSFQRSIWCGGIGDINASMPCFVTAFIEAQVSRANPELHVPARPEGRLHPNCAYPMRLTSVALPL